MPEPVTMSAVILSLKVAAKALLKKVASATLKKGATAAVKKGVTKKAVKKFAKDKLKDTAIDRGKKFLKRKGKEKAQELGQEALDSMIPGESRGGSIVASPGGSVATTPLMGEQGGSLVNTGKIKGKVDFKSLSQKIDNIAGMTEAIARLTEIQSKKFKERAQNIRKRKAQAKQDAREAALESKKKPDLAGAAVSQVKKKAENPLAAIFRFLWNVAIGGLVLFLVKGVQKMSAMWKGLIDGFHKFFWIIRALLWELKIPKALLKGIQGLGKMFKSATKAALDPFLKAGKAITSAFAKVGNAITGWIGNTVNKIKDVLANAAKGAWNAVKNAFPKVFENVGKVAGKVGNAFKAVGNAVTGVVKGAKDIIGGGITKVKDVVGGTLKSAKTFVGSGITKAKDFIGGAFKGAKDFVGGAVKGVKGAVGGAIKGVKGAVGGVFKSAKGMLGGLFKGGAKAGGGVLSKVGKGAGKLLGKAGGLLSKAKGLFGRIPVIGPLMVALASMLSGDPPQQTLFKALGTALGGLAGTFIPIPILGTIIGEIVGEFVGDLFYTLASGGGMEGVVEKTKAKFTQILTGGKAAAEWVGGGIKRYITGFLTETAIDIPEGGGRWTALTKAAEFLGLKDWLEEIGYVNGDGYVTKFPNLLQLLNPFKTIPLLIKSFFPPGEVEAESASVEGGEVKAEVGKEKNTSANGLDTQTDYEKTGQTTVMLPPSQSQGKGGSIRTTKGTILPIGSREALNSYYKAQVKGLLYKA